MKTMKMVKVISVTVVLLTSAAVLGGCAASQSGSAYTRTQTRQAQQVQLGTVQSVREVLIEGTKSGAGVATGAIVGGLAGTQIGGGSGRQIATVLGALGGAYAGAAAEEGITRQPGYEIVVQLDNGRAIAVTQAADEPFYPGERVRLLTAADGTARVSH